MHPHDQGRSIKDKMSAKNSQQKREKEKQVIDQMIAIYCRKNHRHLHKENGLCSACEELRRYARMRVDRCPFMETKTFCSQCKVHCYQPKMQEEIRKVMRFSGPRMLLYHPGMAIWHMISTLKG